MGAGTRQTGSGIREAGPRTRDPIGGIGELGPGRRDPESGTRAAGPGRCDLGGGARELSAYRLPHLNTENQLVANVRTCLSKNHAKTDDVSNTPCGQANRE